MQSTNPILTKGFNAAPAGNAAYQGQYRPDFAPPAQPNGYVPPSGGAHLQGQQSYQQQAPQRVMTLDDVVIKAAITMSVLVAAAVVTMLFLPINLILPVAVVTGLGTFVPVLLVTLRRRVNPAFVLAYSVIEGVFIGALSLLFERLFPGIVAQAALATFVTAGVTLFAYKFFNIRVTARFRKMVLIGTAAFAAVMLLNFILAMFGADTGLRDIGPGAGMLSIVASVVGVSLAVINLVLDFDYIEQGVAQRASEDESWRAAFGLVVTMVWLYTELLRILSYFRQN